MPRKGIRIVELHYLLSKECLGFPYMFLSVSYTSKSFESKTFNDNKQFHNYSFWGCDLSSVGLVSAGVHS